MLLINTVTEPIAMVSGAQAHTIMSPTRAAGIPPMITVGDPAEIGPPT
jgi:hypothetical protein